MQASTLSQAVSKCLTQTDAKAIAKSIGVTQIVAVAEYKRIEALRACRQASRKMQRQAVGTFRKRAMRIVAQHIVDLCWHPSNIQAIRVHTGDIFAVKYTSELADQYSSRCTFRKQVWYIDVTLPRSFMHNFRVVNWEGVPAIVTKSRGNIHKAILFHAKRGGKFVSEKAWIAGESGMYYHAATLHEAVTGLARKVKRQARIDKPINADTLISRSMYRELTGACASGVRSFCNRHGLENVESIKASELVDLLPTGTFGRSDLICAIR